MLESHTVTCALKSKDNREECKKCCGEGDTILHRMFGDNLPENVTFNSRPKELSEQATWTYGVGAVSRRNSKCPSSEVVRSCYMQGTVRSQVWLDCREDVERGRSRV